MKKLALGLLGALALTTGLTGTAQAQPRAPERIGWEHLGCVDVGRRTDFDILTVGKRGGRYRAIKLRAVGNDVAIEDLKVVYGNGVSDDIAVRSRLREGGQTRALDLRGRDRFISRIEIVSKRGFRDSSGRGPAKICVYGLDAGGREFREPKRPNWNDGGRRDWRR